jgi:hypothetical protein
MDNLLQQQARLIEVAQQTQNRHDTHHMNEFDPKFTEYPVLSYVLLDPPEGASRDKLRTRKDGPFQIVNSVGAVYTLQNLLNGKTFDVHISRLSPFNYDETRVNPADVAMHDEQEFAIESILNHRGDRTRRRSMEFLVKWQGYGDDANSWEPYHELRHTQPLINYLNANRMRSLIPASHR